MAKGNALVLALSDSSCLGMSCYAKCIEDAYKCRMRLEYWEDWSKCDYNCTGRCTYLYSTYHLELSSGWLDSKGNKGKAASLTGTLLPGE